MQMNHYTNKKSLALLGHGKWKSALGHTLLLIGMVLVSIGAFAQTPTGGLYMQKGWTPDPTDPTGSKGTIRLETFVTGEKIITEAHIPTDIVIVVDQSGSMAYNFDGTQTQGVPVANQRVTALKNALNTFLTTIQQDAVEYNCDHRIAIVGFGTAPAGNQTTWTNTELLTPSEVNYNNAETQNYKNALVYVNNNGSVNNVLTSAVSNISANGGTMMQYGLIMANNILSVFGFDSYVIIGYEKAETTGIEGHAFNFISYTNDKYERVNALVDFANSVSVFDINFNKLGNSPYIIYLDKLDNEFVNNFINNEVHLINNDYYYVVMGNTLLQLISERNRDYYIGSQIVAKKLSNRCQK